MTPIRLYQKDPQLERLVDIYKTQSGELKRLVNTYKSLEGSSFSLAVRQTAQTIQSLGDNDWEGFWHEIRRIDERYAPLQGAVLLAEALLYVHFDCL